MKIYLKTIAILFVIISSSCSNDGSDNHDDIMWKKVESNSSEDLNSISLFGESTIIVVGNNGTILKSENNGEYWENIDSKVSKNLNAVYFVNPDSGFIVGDDLAFLFTEDKGESWNDCTSYQSDLIQEDIHCAQFFTVSDSTNKKNSHLHGYMGGTNYLFDIYGFYDYDISWGAGNYGGVYNAMNVFPSTVGYAVGDNGIIRKNEFDFNVWILKSSPTAMNLNDVYFANENEGLIIGDNGALFKTFDGGNSWIDVIIEVSNNLNSICIYDKHNGYIVGDGGIILHTTNEGISWVVEKTDLYSNLNSVKSSNSVAIAVGQNGVILKRKY